MGSSHSMSWKPICESIFTISKINFQTENVACLLILDDFESTYVLIGGNNKSQWFFVQPGTLKLLDSCDVSTKRISENISFIGELSKLIPVPTVKMMEAL